MQVLGKLIGLKNCKIKKSSASDSLLKCEHAQIKNVYALAQLTARISAPAAIYSTLQVLNHSSSTATI